MKRLADTPNDQWTKAVIDIPKRRNKRVQYLEEMIRLPSYEGTVRQIAVKGLGRAQPTLFITNNEGATAREIIMNYARRNRIEDGIGTNVDFFHLDSLSSEVRLNVDLDVTMTVIANGCYRWLASKLKGFDKAKAKKLSRKFVETSGTIEVGSNRTLHVTFDRRSHNPIMREAALCADSPRVAWLRRHKIEFHFQ
jgi:hypothetical protein